jgi:hypothetical protein
MLHCNHLMTWHYRQRYSRTLTREQKQAHERAYVYYQILCM